MISRIYKNGTVYTVEGTGWEEKPAEAFAVNEAGRIAAVGTTAEVEALASAETETIDLEGKTVLPGFVDSHVHMPGTAFAELFQICLFGVHEKDETMKVIRDFIESHPDEEAYFGTGFNMGMVDETGHTPTAAWIEEICSDKPVTLQSYDMHSYWMNTKAMEANGITKDTQDPELGLIHRYEDGTPTGLFTDCLSIVTKVAEYDHDQQLQAAKHFMGKMNAWGYTSITSVAPFFGAEPELYKDIEDAGELTLRARVATYIDPKTNEQDLQLLYSRKALDSGLIKVRIAKYLIDGVLEGFTAYLKEPYDPELGFGDDYNSPPEWKFDDLKESFKEVMSKGYQIHLHCIGDAALSMVLDAQEAALAELPEEVRNADHRCTITHLQLVSPEDIDRMAKLGNIAAIQTFWHAKDPLFYTNIEKKATGKYRADHMYPAKSFVDAGVKITASGDFPVSEINDPLLGIKAGVLRCAYSDELFGFEITTTEHEPTLRWPEERLTVKDMIEAYTINGAYQMYCEDEAGSLAAGKSADFVILDGDPFKVDILKLDKLSIQETVFCGKTVYKK